MFEQELRAAIDAAIKAKKHVLEVYETSFAVEIKADNSPVTEADKGSDTIIRTFLQKRFPDYAFLTEESIDDKTRLQNDYVWIVDPVDGTKDFVNHDDEFTINIALAYKHEIVLGVVLVPVSGDIYYALKNGGSFRLRNNIITKLHVNDKINGLTVLTSRYHMNEKEKTTIDVHRNKIVRVMSVGSSLKPCYIAAGEAELSYRFSSGTKEWDTAANQIIVEEAGGVFVKPDGTRYIYNREDVVNREGYVITNRKENLLL